MWPLICRFGKWPGCFLWTVVMTKLFVGISCRGFYFYRFLLFWYVERCVHKINGRSCRVVHVIRTVRESTKICCAVSIPYKV